MYIVETEDYIEERASHETWTWTWTWNLNYSEDHELTRSQILSFNILTLVYDFIAY